jgi:hypothetical protein
MNSQRGERDWRSLAEQTSKETDSAKLAVLVAELCRLLDGEHEKCVRRRQGLVVSLSTDAASGPYREPHLPIGCGHSFRCLTVAVYGNLPLWQKLPHWK